MLLLLGWTDSKPATTWLSLKTAEEAKSFLEANLPWLKLPLEAAEKLVKQSPSRSMSVRMCPMRF